MVDENKDNQDSEKNNCSHDLNKGDNPVPETSQEADVEDQSPFISPDTLQADIQSVKMFSLAENRIEAALEKNLTIVEEVAEDMLELTRRLKAIESQQARLVDRIAALETSVLEGGRAKARDMAALRSVLADEQKGALSRGAFNAVSTVLDFVRSMKEGVDEVEDKRLVRQLQAIELSLKSAIQGLGFSEFGVASGDVFDPGRMECLGYEPGDSGRVTRFVRPGFAIGNIVIRPAGVMLARPESETEPANRKGEENE